MKAKLRVFLLLLFATVYGQAIAQERTVTGRVSSSEDGTTLPGVNVILKGTSIGTTTDIDGKFKINVPNDGGTLVFSFIGLVAEEVKVGNRSVIEVSMKSDVRQLGEVVVFGYGTQDKREFTGAAASVSGEKIASRPVQSFAQAMTGQAAGVNIVQPNGVLNNAPVIRIRGVNSISQSSFPLIVIDGIPVISGDLATNSAANNPLADINPADIESIDVLKDAASTSIYGSRGANGVLIITTKNGKKGKAKVSYDGWVGSTQAVRLPEVLNAQQYMDYKNLAISNALVNNPNAPQSAVPRNADGKGFLPSYNADGSLVDTRWYDEVYQRALSHNHAISVSGGNDQTTYFFSVGFTEQEGFIKKNTFDRKNTRLNLNHKVTDWFSLRGNVVYSNTFNSAPNTGSLPGQGFNTAGLGRLAVALPPNVAPLNPDGSYNIKPTVSQIGNGANIVPMTWPNPVPLLDLNTFTSENSRIISNIGADFQLMKGLTFKTTYSWDRNNTENITFQSPVHGDGFTNGGVAVNNTRRRENWNWINTLNYNTTIAEKHNVSVTIGTDVQKMTAEGWGAQRQNLTDKGFSLFQAGYVDNLASGNFVSLRAFESYLGNLNYNYAGKYFLTGNFRRDGLSALASGNRWGNFGGVSGGWLVSEESFFKGIQALEVISNLKLKGSWGVVGNGNLDSDFGSFSLFSTGLYGEIPTLFYSQAGNTLLSWESSRQTNIGTEIGLFNDKISIEANYFYNNVDGLILSAPQAPSKGIPGNSISTNVGSMYNKGFELGISATPINKGDFRWTTNFNFTHVSNEVTSLAGDNTPIRGFNSGLESASITMVGQPVGSIYVVQTAGVNPENGRRIFVRKDGTKVQYNHGHPTQPWTFLDGSTAPIVTAAEQNVLYNALPKWFGGFTNNFTYKNFDASLLFTYSGGNYIYNGNQAGLRDQRNWNNHTDVLRHWTEANRNTDIPRPVFGDNVSNGSSMPLDVNVEKGDFVRLQNVMVGYRLPKQVFGKSGITNLRIYGQIDNAFLLTKYTGVDPEISSNGQSNLSPGVERNTVPQARVFTLGLNLGF
jgi:TonB-dependent starch-binding outer membrane protein SusC